MVLDRNRLKSLNEAPYARSIVCGTHVSRPTNGLSDILLSCISRLNQPLILKSVIVKIIIKRNGYIPAIHLGGSFFVHIKNHTKVSIINACNASTCGWMSSAVRSSMFGLCRHFSAFSMRVVHCG